MYTKVDDVRRPLKVGEIFLVPCFVTTKIVDLSEEELWMDLSPETKETVYYVLPVINHPHSDKENGQKEIHYHVDNRFIDKSFVVPKQDKYHFDTSTKRPLKSEKQIEYIALKVISTNHSEHTPVELIAKSKLKHKCIHKGKCPHRGYDLSQVKPVNGIIQCPLHGLKFNKETNLIVN